jgi:hypothetical protein
LLQRLTINERMQFSGLPSIAADAAGSCRKVRVDLEGGLMRLLVLWIAVHQPEEGGPARYALGRHLVGTTVDNVICALTGSASSCLSLKVH